MLSNFAKNQKGGVSPHFAIMACTIFLVIGGGLYFQGDEAYRFFDSLMREVRFAARL